MRTLTSYDKLFTDLAADICATRAVLRDGYDTLYYVLLKLKALRHHNESWPPSVSDADLDYLIGALEPLKNIIGHLQNHRE